MSYRIRCYTLFNITQTGVANRSKPNQDDIEAWIEKRNTQCNFDTLLQVISLRSQPEIVKAPTMTSITPEIKGNYGFLYEFQESDVCWKFDFEVQHPSVFEDGITTFGYLYNDCQGVPMISCKDQHENMPNFLNITAELKNIYFEVV